MFFLTHNGGKMHFPFYEIPILKNFLRAQTLLSRTPFEFASVTLTYPREILPKPMHYPLLLTRSREKNSETYFFFFPFLFKYEAFAVKRFFSRNIVDDIETWSIIVRFNRINYNFHRAISIGFKNFSNLFI